MRDPRRTWSDAALWIGGSLLLSLFTVYLHAHDLGRIYVESYQVQRHHALLAGSAGNPWQYRVLSAWIVEGFHQLFRTLALPQPLIASFVVVRVVQETILFIVAWRYWRALGLTVAQAFVGLAIFGWSVSYANHGSDFQFNTYFDALFYVLAGLAVIRNRLEWILPITLAAALNRETSGFIPLLPLVTLPSADRATRAKVVRIAAASLIVYMLVFAILRAAYGPQELILPYGHHLGLDLLLYNVGRARTWVQLAATFSIIPALAWMGYRHWPPVLKSFFWLVVPVWFLVHWFGAVMSETRLLLVPMALVLIPGALMLLREDAPASAPAGAA